MSVFTGGDDDLGDPLVATEDDSYAVGQVRLDNRSDLERRLGVSDPAASDLEIALRFVLRNGDKAIGQLLGDFGFVAWDCVRRTVVAACDAFAVKKLYYAHRNGFLLFSSRAEALAADAQYESQYLAEFVTNCTPAPGLTVYQGVHALGAGTMLLLHQGKLSLHAYWSADHYEATSRPAMSELEAAEQCRELIGQSLQCRISPAGSTWAQLSGGLDSSSLVSLAQSMAESGAIPQALAGTVTYVDRAGTGCDEREYSDAIVKRWGLRNECIIEPPQWRHHRYGPPRTDQPRASFLFHPREYELCSVIKRAGGSVLLTGMGGDELLTGTLFFFADWLGQGRLRDAIREMDRWAAVGRVSFWELAYRNAVLPILPARLQQRLLQGGGDIPRWIPRAVIRKYDLNRRSFTVASYSGHRGHKHHSTVVMHLRALATNLETTVIEDILDVRHPYLYRPLVEFALGIPTEWTTRPHQRKWILREAMRGIVPESVRLRVGKGTPASLYASTLTTHRELLRPLAEEPMLGELGIVDGRRLQAAFEKLPNEPHERDEQHGMFQATLMAEAWLQIRSGRWPRPEGYNALN